MKFKFKKPDGYYVWTMTEKAAWLKKKCDRIVTAYNKGYISLNGRRPSSKQMLASEISKYLQRYLSRLEEIRLTDRDIETAIDLLGHQFLTNVEFQNECTEKLREIVGFGYREYGISEEFYNVINATIRKARKAWKETFPNAKYADKTPSEAIHPVIRQISSDGIFFALSTILCNPSLNALLVFLAANVIYGVNGELSDSLTFLMHVNQTASPVVTPIRENAKQLLEQCQRSITTYEKTRLNLFGYRRSIHLELLKAIQLYLDAYLNNQLATLNVGGPTDVYHNPPNDRDLDFMRDLIGKQYQFSNDALIAWVLQHKPNHKNEYPNSEGFSSHFNRVFGLEAQHWQRQYPQRHMIIDQPLDQQMVMRIAAIFTASIMLNYTDPSTMSISILLVLSGLVYLSGDLVDNMTHLTSFTELSPPPLARRF